MRTFKSVVAVLVGLLVIVHGTPALAYLKLGVSLNGRLVELRWDRPVRYFVTDTAVSGVNVSQFQTALSRAFATWDAVPTSTLTYEFAGFTSALPGDEDGWSTIGFLNEPDLDRVLASTTFLIDESTGQLIESDIFFNSAFEWSTSAEGQPNRFDVETIALHEIGHLSGLGHSAIGETSVTGSGRRVQSTGAVMFPIAFAAGTVFNRALRADDIAGLSDLYPAGDFDRQTGSISGRVTKDSRGIFGAHVVAFNASTGDLVGNFSLNDAGDFAIAGLSPGAYAIRVEPLDDADVESFFSGPAVVDVDFKVVFSNRLVVVPRGGDSGRIQLKVARK